MKATKFIDWSYGKENGSKLWAFFDEQDNFMTLDQATEYAKKNHLTRELAKVIGSITPEDMNGVIGRIQ